MPGTPGTVDEADPVACRVRGRAPDPDEPRRLVPVLPDDPMMPPAVTGVACPGRYRGRQQTYVPGAAEGRETSRVLAVLAGFIP